MKADSEVNANKAAATEFLRMVVAGQIEEAYDRYVDMQGKHHNVYFPAGFEALKKAMLDNHTQFPVKEFTTKNVLGDGNLVAVHSYINLMHDDPGLTVVHLFRFEGSKITEMWDIGQEIPHDLPNKDGAI